MHPDDPSAADAAAEGPDTGPAESRAAADGDGAERSSSDESGTSARKRRARRRRRARASRSPDEGAGPEDSGSDAPADAGGGDDAADGAAREGRSRRKRRRSRGRGRSRAADGAGTTSDSGSDGGEPAAEADDPRERRRRRRRKRRAGREGGADPEGAPAARDDEGASGDEESGRRKRRRRRRKDKDKDKDRRKERAKDRGKDRAKGDGSGRRRRDGRRREGRRDGGRDRRRTREGRRDRRLRDPRAVDIVPKLDFGTTDAPLEKILLVNATDREEARIALLVNGRLEEIYIEALKERSAAGNIYRGRIQNVEIGIGAAFVDLGRGTTGFLHASDMPLKEDEEPGEKVTDRLHPGDEVIVQITRDGIGRKGPALTGRISLPGRYLVLMPFTSRSGISRRIPRGPERERMRKLVRKLEVPDGMGVIVRTASETTDLAALDADLQHLVTEWERIRQRAAEPGQPGVLRGESDIAERSVRDIMPSDVTRIVVDKEQTAGRIHQLLRIWYPSEAAAAAEAGHLSIRMATAEADTPVGELRTGSEPADSPQSEDAEPPSDAPQPKKLERFVSATGSASASDSPAAVDDEPAADELRADEDVPTDDEAPTAEDERTDDEVATEEIDEGETDEGETDEDETDEDETDEDEGDEDEPTADRAAREARLAEQRRLAKIIPEVLLHTDAMPLFHTYDVETQLEDAFRRALRLPSGGSIVIDPTEALVAVDVNSGRLTDESDPETTALKTNLEAVGEIARQLRLRDLGGLVVLDFIDMRERKSRREVQAALHEALSRDRARIRVGRMGPFGCVIMSRQRIRQALSRVTHEACDTCGGTGHRRVASGLGLRVLREMEARVARSRGRGGLEVRAPQSVVDWIRKHRGSLLNRMKKACSGPVTLTADSRLAVDGWAMKGTPPSRKEAEEEG